MLNSAPRLKILSSAPDASELLATSELEQTAEGWHLSCDIEQHSSRTIERRRDILNKLDWFLKKKNIQVIDRTALRGYLHYLTHGHEEEGGRWGNPQCTKAVRPRTVHTVHGHLRSFFNWCIEEGILSVSPMDRIAAPIARADQIRPYTAEECDKLLKAAKAGNYPKRDVAMHYLMLDTGLRATELCGLPYKDLNILGKRVMVLGKGGKTRSLPFHKTTTKAILDYVRSEGRTTEDMLFMGERGPFTRSGLLQLVVRWGERASVDNAHPHRYRHTFAVEFLRAGGNVFSLQMLLGHTNLQMTQRYVAFAQADIEVQHRLYSPVEAQKKRTRA